MLYTRHGNAGLGDRHPVYNWVYADEAARLAASGFTGEDIGRLAKQEDDGSYWELTSLAPAWNKLGFTGSLDGVLDVTITAATEGDILVYDGVSDWLNQDEIIKEDAVTNDVTDILGLGHNSSGAPVAGFGTGLAFEAETSTTEDVFLGDMQIDWVDPTHASRQSAFLLNLVYAGNVRDVVRVVGPVSVSVAGLTRGYGSVDFQNSRANNTEIASGNYSTVKGGKRNTGQEFGSTISGGLLNSGYVVGGGHYNQSGTRESNIFGGAYNDSSSLFTIRRCVTCGGYGNEMSYGRYDVIWGGKENEAYHDGAATHTFQSVSGYWAYATLVGQVMSASGRFAAKGDAQGTIQVLSRLSDTFGDATWRTFTPATLFIAADSVWSFDIVISGTTQGSTKSFGFRIRGAVENDGGTTTVLASTVTTIYDGDDVSFDVRVQPNDANDSLEIQASDSDGGGDTVRFLATVRMAEVTYPA